MELLEKLKQFKMKNEHAETAETIMNKVNVLHTIKSAIIVDYLIIFQDVVIPQIQLLDTNPEEIHQVN